MRMQRNISHYINRFERLLNNRQTELDFVINKLKDSNEKPNEMQTHWVRLSSIGDNNRNHTNGHFDRCHTERNFCLYLHRIISDGV